MVATTPTERPIVVGVDDAPGAEDAVALATRFARITGAPMLLVCAYPWPLPSDIPPVETAQADLRRWAQLTVDRAAEHAGTEARTRIAMGSAAHVLDHVAKEVSARLIVVGTSHAGGLRRVLPGSTGERLLNGAPAPVAMAPEGYRRLAARRFERITCAFDGSPETVAAVGVAREVARAAAARVRLACVAGPAVPHSGWDVEEATARRTWAEHTLAEAVAPGEEASVLHGDAVQALAAESASTDLLVLGSRGYGPLHSVCVGGVSGPVIHEAACPVLVTPRGATARLLEHPGLPAAAPR